MTDDPGEVDQYEPERTDWERDTLGTVCSVDDQSALQVSDRHDPEAFVASTVAVFDVSDMA